MSGDTVLTVGVIGAGDIAARVHLPVLLAMNDVRVSWVMDRDARRARRVAEMFGIGEAVASDEPNSLPPSDVTLISLPHRARAGFIEACAIHGAAAYVEKPFARTVREHERTCAPFEVWRIGCGLQYRAWGPTVLLRNMVESKVYGRVKSITCERGSPLRSSGGRSTEDAGGVMFDLGVHGLDMALFITQASAGSVRASRLVREGAFDLHASSVIGLEMPDGGECELHHTASWLSETRNSCEFVFETATVDVLYQARPDVIVTGRNGGKTFVAGVPKGEPYPVTAFQTFHAHWRNFLRGVRGRSAGPASALSSILTTALLEEIYSVASEG